MREHEREALRFEGSRLVRCPETGKIVEVELDGMFTALHAAAGLPGLRLSSCSRWREAGPCDQACIRGVDPAWARDHMMLLPSPRLLLLGSPPAPHFARTLPFWEEA